MLPTPAECMNPFNDMALYRPYNGHSSKVSEMLIIDETSTCFSRVQGYENPFHLTKYPRILSVYDLIQVKGEEITNSIVDLTCKFKGTSETLREINKNFSCSGFLVAPPNKLDHCWEYYFATCLHNYFPTMQMIEDESGEMVILHPQVMRGSVGRNSRAMSDGIPCEIVAHSASLIKDENGNDKEENEENPHTDWCLMKMVVPIEHVKRDPTIYPSKYLLPSPSKAFDDKPTSHDYDMCIATFLGEPTEWDVETLSNYNLDIDLEMLSTFFEGDCKNISFGKYIDSHYYNASTLPGASGGAVLGCAQDFCDWSSFKENLTLNRNVVGIHMGSHHSYNRFCPVKYWFSSFYEKVFLPMKQNFTIEEREFIEEEKMFLDEKSNRSSPPLDY